MPEFFLDLDNRSRVLRFLVEYEPYADPDIRTASDEAVNADAKGEPFAEERLAERARMLALHVWPAREALEAWFQKHPEKEWEAVLSSVRPETKKVLMGMKRDYGIETLERVFADPETEALLDEEERLEVASVRREVRLAAWKDNRAELAALMPKGEKLRDAYAERFDVLREFGNALPPTLQDEAYSKLFHYEDRVLFEGEHVPIEVIDEEIAYYRDQVEITPSES